MTKSRLDEYDKDYGQCKATSETDFILSFPNVLDGTDRQQRVHTCFRNCKDYIYDNYIPDGHPKGIIQYKDVFTVDTRPNCTVETDLTIPHLNENDERFLLCLYPVDDCEQTVHAEEGGWGQVKIVITRGIFAVIYATPVQFIFELLCIYLIKIKHNDQKAGENCKILTF